MAEMESRRYGGTGCIPVGLAAVLVQLAVREGLDVDCSGLLHAAFAGIVHEDALIRFLQWPFEHYPQSVEGAGQSHHGKDTHACGSPLSSLL